MAGTEQFGIPKAILGAIGRPLDPTWTDHFADVARSILPSTVELHMRKLPGVAYIPGDNLPRNLGLEAEDDDDRHIRLQEYASSMVASLSDQDQLHKEVALDTIDVSLHKPKSISLKRPRSACVTMLVELDDTLNSSEDGYDYQIQAERDAFLDKFHIGATVVTSTRQQPMYHVAIGRITGFAPHQSFNEIGEALPEPVALLGITALNLGLVS